MKKYALVLLLIVATFALAQDKPVDWEARCDAKIVEIEAVIEILGPVVTYLTEAFEKNTFTETTTEEWGDAVTQFTYANKYYDLAKSWMKEGKYNKLTFLKLEEAWQYYVKTGVAGLRTKSMVDHELGVE